MAGTERRTVQTNRNGMKIVFEFPVKSTADELIRREVNSIMRSALHEQLQHRPS